MMTKEELQSARELLAASEPSAAPISWTVFQRALAHIDALEKDLTFYQEERDRLLKACLLNNGGRDDD